MSPHADPITPVHACVHTHTHTHTHKHTHNGILFNHKKKEMLPFAIWMALEGIMLNETSDRDRQILHDITYMQNL